jgi:hypothetical protein
VPLAGFGEVADGRYDGYIGGMTKEERQLLTKHADKVFHGQTVRQQLAICDCGKAYDEKELFEAPAVFFTDVEVFGETFTLIEPVCPRCNRKISARFSILN